MNARTLQFVLELATVLTPEGEQRIAFAQAGLDRAGLDFAKVRQHPRAGKLLSFIAGANARGYPIAAKAYARQILTMKGELK